MPVFIYAGNNYLNYLYSNLLNENQYHLGQLIYNSHFMNWGYSEYAKDNALSSICGGDPTLEIWTGTQAFFEDVDISICEDSITITDRNIGIFDINISNEEGCLLGKYHVQNGNLTIPKPSENCEIALIKHNYVPYIIHVNVEDHYIQNRIITDGEIYQNTPISVGYDVEISLPSGNVILLPGSNLIINRGNGVLIKNGFECRKGASLKIE